MTNLYPIDNRLDFGSVLEGDVFARVFIKQRWADAWVERLDIVATQILWAAAPNTGSASIHRRYGPVVDRGDDAPVNRTPIELGGWYVKIVVTCPDGDRNWHGYVIDVGDEPGGVQTIATIAWATGKQTWQCVGMLAALDRDTLRESKWLAQTTFDDPDGSLSRIVESAPYFNPTVQQTVNGQSISRQMPNRREALFHARNYFGGSGDPSFWTPREIVAYLVEWSGPKDELSQSRIPLELESPTQLPDFGRPEIDCEGLTFKQVLDRLMNPATGLGYWVWIKTPTIPTDPEILVIQPFTLAAAAITINPTSSWTLAETEHITDLYCGNDPATSYTVQSSLATRYNRVRAVGARRIVVCTKRFSRDNIGVNWNQGWTTAEVNAWQATTVPAGTNSLEATQQRLDLLEEGRFERIFRFFALRLSSLVDNDESTEIFARLFKVSDTEEVDYYLPDRWRFAILPDLPLKSGVDYSLANSDIDHRASRATQRGMAVYGPQHALTGGTTPGHNLTGPKIDWANRSHVDLWYHVGRPNYQLAPSPYETGVDVGLRLDVSGASQAVLGSGFAAVATVPSIDTATLIVTFALQEDRRCEALYPDDPADLPDVDSILELRLDAGDSYRRVDLKKGTVVGFDHAGDYKVVPADIKLEDDSDELANIARLAWEWYSKTRSILRLNSRRPTARLWPGVLVRDLNPALTPIAREVNTTITEIAITLPTNPGVTPGSPRMEIVTSTGDVDFVRYIPRLRV